MWFESVANWVANLVAIWEEISFKTLIRVAFFGFKYSYGLELWDLVCKSIRDAVFLLSLFLPQTRRTFALRKWPAATRALAMVTVPFRLSWSRRDRVVSAPQAPSPCRSPSCQWVRWFVNSVGGLTVVSRSKFRPSWLLSLRDRNPTLCLKHVA